MPIRCPAVRDAQPAQDRLAGNGALPDRNHRGRVNGKIDIDPAAEADQADALSRPDNIAGLDERHDPARDQSRDLGKADPDAIVSFDENMLALIFLGGLVEIGV